jgi:transglutaminase-like putative cysteine protease
LRQAGRSALVWFQWFPIILFPFMVAQAYNESSTVGLATFSWWLRKQEAREGSPRIPRPQVNIGFVYLALCLLASSTGTEPGRFFYFGVVFLIGWALWSVRARHRSVAAWCGLFAVVAATGYGTQQGLFHLQKMLEEMNVRWFSRFAGANFHARESRTALGSIGRVKLSNRIILRVWTDGGEPPELLREASYDIYRAPLWTTGLRRDFGRVLAETDNETWLLLPDKKARRSVTIAQYLRRGSGLLALPSGTAEILQMPLVSLSTNLFGAAQVENGPGLLTYRPRYDTGAVFDSEPNPDDFRSYRDSEPSVGAVAAEIGLRPGMPADEALKRVDQLFREKFSYSTYLSSSHVPGRGETALGRFLNATRSGHCEYFATATALLLREAGLPTRYAVGYSVQEGSGKRYLVRARHAHAWALVYYNNSWHDFDTTPASWDAVESRQEPWFQPLKDFFSELWFQFSRFRWGKTEWRKYLIWSPVPILVLVLGRFFLAKQWKGFRRRREASRKDLARPGIDSDFYLIEKHFARRGLQRHPSETWRAWLRRVEQRAGMAAQIDRLLLLHHRHRFDPSGLSPAERAELRGAVTAWLKNSRRAG